MTLDAILDSCVEDLRQTGNLEACVQQHPEREADLRPLLQTALVVMRAPTPALPSTRKARDLKDLTALVEQRRSAAHRRRAFPRLWSGGWGLGPILQGARLAATLAVVAVLFWGVALAVGDSQPGTFFYPLRRTVEHARLAASRRPADHAQTRLLLARRRLVEFQSLTGDGSLDLAADVLVDMQNDTRAALHAIAETSPQDAVPLLSQAVALLQDEVVALGRAADRATGTPFGDIFTQARTTAQSQLARAEQAWQQPDAVKTLLADEPTPTPLPEPTATPQAGADSTIPNGPTAESQWTPLPTLAPMPTLTLPPIPTMPPLPALEGSPAASPVPASGAPDRSGLSYDRGQQSEPQPDSGDQKDKSGEDGSQHDDDEPKDEDPQHD